MDVETFKKTLSDIGERFIYATVRGLNWFFAQMLVLFVLGTVSYITGILFVDVDSMTLKWYCLWILLASSMFTFVYTIMFNWFYEFVPIKHFIKSFWIPYLIYILFWSVAIDDIQGKLLAYLMPLYGMCFTYIIWKLTKRFKELSIAFSRIKEVLGEITLRKALFAQTLGVLLIGLMEYFNIHPISALLEGTDKWDFTSELIWMLLVVCPAIYAIYHKVKKVWLPISIAMFPFILIGVLAMVIFVKDFV